MRERKIEKTFKEPPSLEYMIYDCFTFFNELELLKIRLEELSPYVDYFVISEGDKTHSGKKKEFNFLKNKALFKKWKKKIIYLKVNMPKLTLLDKALIKIEKTPLYFLARWITINFGLGRWHLENFQRTALISGLINANEKDIIMVSDLDEIPSPDSILEGMKGIKKNQIIKFRQQMFYYFLNGKSQEIWTGTKMCTYETLKKRLRNNPQFLRVLPIKDRVIQKIFPKKRDISFIQNGGWHFSYLGGIEKIKTKREALAHTEISDKKLLDKKDIEQDLKEGIFKTKDKQIKLNYIKIDKTFPNIIYRNKKRYLNLIK
jgi:beta-1,4-mannosyl-glycoprotein beta-1,4-N-acetylglucosaminyltransferase